MYFPKLSKRSRSLFRNVQKKKVQNIAKNLVYYIAEKNDSERPNTTSLGKEGREEIVTTLNNLREHFHYSQEGAVKILQYAIKEFY